MLLAPWAVAAGCGWAAHKIRQQARSVEQAAHQEQVRQEGIEPGMWVGPYRVDKAIGAGAQADVFLARDESGQAVALKIMSASISKDRESRTRFEREADSGSRFDHPNVIRILRWSILDGRLWMAQPYLAGGSLADRLRPGGMPIEQVLGWLQDIAAGLSYAHQRKVIHRDLKPHNVLLDENGRAVLADFGLARAARYETITGDQDLLGSPAYMAPEQIQGQQVTVFSDLYSLGIIGYELLTGSPPFMGEIIKVLMSHVSDTPPSVAKLRPDAPPRLVQLIEQLLAKEPTDRPQSAAEVTRVLESLCKI
jgi:serine/threonine-protein kinase